MLYHRDLGFPKNLKLPIGQTFLLSYSYHATEAARQDRYGAISLPKHLVIKKEEIVEVEIEKSVAVKLVMRVHFSETLDLCLAILIQDQKVKTVWLNKKEDVHKTLNKNKYEIPIN